VHLRCDRYAAHGAVWGDMVDLDSHAVAGFGGRGFEMDVEVALAAAVMESVKMVLLFDQEFDGLTEKFFTEFVTVR
jgi:hypothetical protein